MNRLLCLSALAVALATPCVRAQTPESKVEFEVASVKPFSIAQTDGAVTLGARIDGAQVRLLGLAMRDLISMAYRIKLYQLSGPEWIQTERYDINAKLPAGVSPEKLPEMTQALLAERFGLKVHREKKEMPVYALLVGKPPLRLKDSAVDPNAPPPKAVEVSGTGSAAGISVNLGNGASYTFAGGKLTAKKVTAPTIAAVLERFTDRPVIDLTELKGTYDFEFEVSPEETQTLMIRAAVAAGVQLPPQALRLLESGGNPIENGAEQLGLKIEGRKMPVDIVVIDQVQKTPTDN
jgi:uncharacterized protein (TIGR03435 family)